MVELLVAFNSDDVPGGALEVTNFQFHTTTVKGDLNLDKRVDLHDFSLLASYWLSTDCDTKENCEGADFEPDGDVDLDDLLRFSGHWLVDMQ